MKIGLNVGSGQRKFTSVSDCEWINIDAVPNENPDVLADAKSLPYPDQFADFVVSHHCYEHVGCGDAKQSIQEAHRVLKDGGSYIVCVPDMTKLAKMFLNGEFSPDPDVNTQIYMTNVYGAYVGNEESRHKFGFTERSLFRELTFSAPWSTVRFFDFRDIPGANIARDDRWILSLEAVR